MEGRDASAGFEIVLVNVGTVDGKYGTTGIGTVAGPADRSIHGDGLDEISSFPGIEFYGVFFGADVQKEGRDGGGGTGVVKRGTS